MAAYLYHKAILLQDEQAVQAFAALKLSEVNTSTHVACDCSELRKQDEQEIVDALVDKDKRNESSTRMALLASP
jgi:hypothetical protein